jgi:uncharacterized protein (TIGR02996 family)
VAAESDLLRAIEADPADDLAWLALADCLEEAGETDRAEVVRLREWLRFADVTDPERGANERRLGELLLDGVLPAVPTRTLELSPRVAMTLALIPPGSFWMGSTSGEAGCQSDECPRHRVRISKPFWIGVTPVTNVQWRAVLEPQSAAGPRPSHPVQSVLWGECTKFHRALGKLTGESFRLPTEAEWEHACRAGTSEGVYLGDFSKVDLVSWNLDNSRGRVQMVMKKPPNAWGLYDVLGNVWEWCADGKRAYTAARVTDPVGPNGARRVVKGGAWRSGTGRCRAGARYAEGTTHRTDDQGFRVVMDWA